MLYCFFFKSPSKRPEFPFVGLLTLDVNLTVVAMIVCSYKTHLTLQGKPRKKK